LLRISRRTKATDPENFSSFHYFLAFFRVAFHHGERGTNISPTRDRGRTMLNDLLKPHIQLGSFLLRLGLACIFIFHGYIKVVQGFGSAWHPTLTEATQVAVTYGELLCGSCFLFGLFSRLAALGIVVIQVGAIIIEKAKLDFINTDFIKPSVLHIGGAPTGVEYNFALITMCLAVLAIGSGMVSLDYLFFGRKVEAPAPAGKT
jgi:uncharacterized membrane protein YphA (DoxX/SURF4 family)